MILLGVQKDPEHANFCINMVSHYRDKKQKKKMKPTKEIQQILDRALGVLEYEKGDEAGKAYMIDSIDLPGQVSIYNWVADHESVFKLCGSVCNYLQGSPPACPRGHLFWPCVEVLKKQGYKIKILKEPSKQYSEPGRIH